MFLIPGINTDPQSWTCWPNPFAPRVNQRGGEWRAQPMLYETTTVDTHEEERIQTCANLLKAYEGCEIHVTMHSNGNRVGVGGWNAAGRPKVKTLHMLCGACDADFETLGLNQGLLDGTIEQVFCYVAGSDSAMKIEDTLPGDLLFGIPLGHKPLGLDGPRNYTSGRVHVIRWAGYDHSTCWDEQHFDGTVEQIMASSEP
jgi:hypothetical protein